MKRSKAQSTIILLSMNAFSIVVARDLKRPANCSNKDDLNTQNPCAKYNSFMHRLNWASRKEKCLAEKGCKFDGWRSLGGCVLDEDAVANQDIVTQEIHHRPTAPNPSSESSQDESLTFLERANRGISDSIVESLVSSMAAMTPSISASATDAVNIGVTSTHQSPQLISTMGKFLSASLQAPKVEENLLWNWVWLIKTDLLFDNAYYQAKYQRDYWLGVPAGYDYTLNSLSALAVWYLLHPLTQRDTLVPLMEWSLQQKDLVFDPAVASINDVLTSKNTKQMVFDGIKDMLLSGMKSEYAKNAAIEELINVLKQKAASAISDNIEENASPTSSGKGDSNTTAAAKSASSSTENRPA